MHKHPFHRILTACLVLTFLFHTTLSTAESESLPICEGHQPSDLELNQVTFNGDQVPVKIEYYYPGRKTHEEWQLTDTSLVKTIHSYWRENRSYPKFDFSKVATPLNGSMYVLTYSYPNGDTSLVVSVFEEGLLQVLNYSMAIVYEDSNHFYEFLSQQEVQHQKEPCNDPSLRVVHNIYSGMQSPEWAVCGDQLNRYRSLLKGLQPTNKLRSCDGLGLFILSSAKQIEGFPNLLTVCPGVISEGWNSAQDNVASDDVKDLFHFLKTKFPAKDISVSEQK